jgi:predicted  nucleic acid-binding Zn-ribbon protein
MSPIGRIFIVLNLVLAVTFMAWASSALASSQDYKQQLADEKAAHAAAVDALTQERDSERARAELAESDLVRVTNELNTTDATLKQVEGAKSAAETNLGELKASYESMSQTMGTYNDTNEALSRQKDDLNEKLGEKTTENNDLNNQVAALTEENNNLERTVTERENTIADLERQATALQNSLSDANTLIATAEASLGTSFADLMAMPHISGAILMVSDDMAPGLVSINRGSADNVKRGFTFDVYSGGVYKGRVRVVNVQENQCFAVIEKTYEGRSIAQGDSAATHI